MSLSDELRKLAELRREGVLTDGEFGDAKRKLLEQEPKQRPFPSPNVEGALVEDDAGQIARKTYWSSRWSSGNLFFRDSVVLAADGIMFRKRRLFGSKEEHINYRAIASIRIKNGIFLSNISIETSGGSQPIFINGLWKTDAKEIQDGIRASQEKA
jgi:hypothetical protein